MVLVVIFKGGNPKVRIPDVAKAYEENNQVVAFDAGGHSKGHFNLDDVRSWHLDAD